MILEIKKQLKRINDQIETEKRIHNVWTNYKDCAMKTQVIHQSIGVIRGLEIAKESLEYILGQEQTNQLTIDEYSQIDYRGGLAAYIDDGMAGRL